MNGVDTAQQQFDASFDTFFQPPLGTSPGQHHAVHHHLDSPSSFANLAMHSAQDPSSASFSLDPGSMRPGSSSGGNLHLNISNLSVNGDSDPQLSSQQHQQQQPTHASMSQRFAANMMLGGTAHSSPVSTSASPADPSAAFAVADSSPMLRPDLGVLDRDPNSGATGVAGPSTSSPLKTEFNLSDNGGGSLTSAMRSYSSHSLKSATGSQNADSPTSGHGVGGNNLGDASVDEANTTAQSEADLAAEKRQSSKFVYKLFRMVSDPDYQHLISWNRNGTSVMVCNFDEFAKEVLGKHFKHSNFSSFIRQLNMYGFYKVNKTPRGHRQSVDAQIWEFSHPKFIRGRPDLLDDIRRKALDSEHARVEARDLQYSVSVGQMQLRQQVDEMQFRIDELTEQNMALRTFTTQLRDVLGLVLEHVKRTSGGGMALDVRIPTLDLPSPMPPQGMWTPHAHDGPPIFVTEPEFGGAAMGHGGIGMGAGLGVGGAPNQRMPGGGPVYGGGPDPFGVGMGGTPLSRRVSSSSAHSDSMLGGGMNGSPVHAGMHPDGAMMPPMVQRSASFGEGQMMPPQFALGRPTPNLGARPGLAGLAIDTSAAGAYMGAGVSPTSAGLTASNAAGMGMMSMPPSPLTPQHQAMMAAINTPLPPSPAPGSVGGGQFNKAFDGSPFMAQNGTFGPFGGHPVLSAGDQAFFGPDGEGPNAKAMRTPMKRTASNSGPSHQGTPILVQNATSPGLSKRKSPI
ncbi:hypothetical protein BCV70DRAFT_17300 [Testicularia cyperi]|uniref:HSF-type DNA-binding domain-containing protein n=1 Tax=Testicularia cyperi TaxID=1882483 RepID=A0A317XYR2_9BASI|nr:hypothetical protein BCV70DRAFT_17300 [Testicularia cyperi]